jgi:hypothetical protein
MNSDETRTEKKLILAKNLLKILWCSLFKGKTDGDCSLLIYVDFYSFLQLHILYTV